MAFLTPSMNRRNVLKLAGGGAAALALHPLTAGAATLPASPVTAVAPAPSAAGLNTHNVWVWQFSTDGRPETIREKLAAHGLGIALKTHDGVTWMSKYDTSPAAVSGPRRIAELAEFFEAGGVPFHAWAVVHGSDPTREATMAAEVLRAGARTIALDLESYRGFWVGTNAGARQFGDVLRTAQPDKGVLTSIDARPWEIDRIPLKEFANFSNAIAPQVYWSDFSTPANITKYWIAGEIPGSEGVTARFALDVAAKRLQAFGLPIHPIGPGLVADRSAWGSFIERSFAHEANTISSWRYGTTSAAVFGMLQDNPPRVDKVYTVKPGDSLGYIAVTFNTTVSALMKKNGITNPNLIRIGQQLIVPA